MSFHTPHDFAPSKDTTVEALSLFQISHLEDTKVTSPSLLLVPHKDKEGVETVEQQEEVEQCSPLYTQALFLPVPSSTFVLLAAVPMACPPQAWPASLVVTHWL